MMTSKRVYIKRDLPRLLLPVPHPCGEPLTTHSSIGDPPTLAGILVQSPVESLLLSSESWCAQVLFVLSKTAVSASPSPMEVLNKILLASKSDSLGIPSPFVRSPGWEAWHGVPNLHNSGRTSLVLLFSSLWVTHLWFYHDCAPPCCLSVASSLTLDVGYLVLVGSSTLLSIVVQQLVVISVLSQEQMCTCPSLCHLDPEAHFSILVWRISRPEEPGGLQSIRL